MKKLVILLVLLLVIAGGAGAGWYFFLSEKPEGEPEEIAESEDTSLIDMIWVLRLVPIIWPVLLEDLV